MSTKLPSSTTFPGTRALEYIYQKNAQAYITPVRYRSEAAALIHNIFHTESRTNANLMIKKANRPVKILMGNLPSMTARPAN